MLLTIGNIVCTGIESSITLFIYLKLDGGRARNSLQFGSKEEFIIECATFVKLSSLRLLPGQSVKEILDKNTKYAILFIFSLLA